MKIILSSRRHHYVARVSIFLVTVALIAGMVGCGGDGDGGESYTLTIASTAGGSVTTPGEGTFTYSAGTVVNLVATPDAGYHFVNWTGDVGTIADVEAATTTITVNGDYTITANFALGTLTYDLTIISTEGGEVTTPGEGTFTYNASTVVNLVATPDAGYQFVNWTGDVGTIADVNAASTTITMNGDYSITANFALGTLTYDLTITSTEGGSVTTPGEGTFNYTAGTVVNLVATSDGGYRFVNWTGDVGTIGNVNAATTIITTNGDYSITANFALGTLIAGVPDTNQSNQPPQSPTQTIPSTVLITNYCAPMAVVNILEYWDVVMGHANAVDLNAGLIPETAAEYIGYFMNTNDNGSPDRLTKGAGHAGTVDPDIGPGILEFVRWDASHPFPIGLAPAPPPALPAGKIGYNWMVILDAHVGGFPFYTDEIDAGRPLVVCFSYWNPDPTGIQETDPATGETIYVFEWLPWAGGSSDPPEEWDEGIIGHAVTGVGYILNWDPDGSGPKDYVIVHDNWDTTPENVAIPWDRAKWNISHRVDPAGVPPAKQDLTISIGGFPCGSVTTPGVGTFTCDAGAVVNLVATPGAECVFDNWTGDVGTIADVNAASTTITMNGDYSITANFLFSPVIPI